MSTRPTAGLLAIDVGSSRVKLGWFPPPGECTSEPKTASLPLIAPKLPQPEATLAVSHLGEVDIQAEINEWLEQYGATEPRRFVASVHPEATVAVKEIFAGEMRMLATSDMPIKINVDQPERVGIDRLLNAVATNRLRQPKRPTIVIDMGTACTVDLISSDGAFEGGAILPGSTLSAAALRSGTATLPELAAESFDSPPAVVGKSTQAAISAGLYWGMVGAVHELVDRIAHQCKEPPQVFLTGGEASRLVAPLTTNQQDPPRHIPHLVLSGIAVVAKELT